MAPPDSNQNHGPNLNPDPFGPGCLDNTLTVFERHAHPFIVVGTLAGRWSSTNGMPKEEVDLLMREPAIQPIVDDLVAEEWVTCTNPYESHISQCLMASSSYDNTTSMQDIWLKYRHEGYLHPMGLKYLRLWPEGLYQLSIDCRKIEIPDMYSVQMVTFEEEYYRDPLRRFGPSRLSILEALSEPILQHPSRRVRDKSHVPMFIPIIEDHLNALLDQLREEDATRTKCGNCPEWHIRNFIRYHIWEWPATSAWLLANKVRDRNYDLMKDRLDHYVRKMMVTYDPVKGARSIYPWERDPNPPLVPVVDADTARTAHARLMALALLK